MEATVTGCVFVQGLKCSMKEIQILYSSRFGTIQMSYRIYIL
jgi:hypothetical protein